MNKLDELYAKAVAANTNRKETAQKNVNEILSLVFAEMPKLGRIRVRGYTPGFNDGDPCTHSQTLAVDVYDPNELYHDLHYGDEDEKREMEQQLQLTGPLIKWSRHWDYENDCRRDNNPLPSDPHQAACIKAYEVVDALEGDFEILFETNFTLDIVRDPNSELGFRIDHSHYDCGY